MEQNNLYNKTQHCGRPQRGTHTAIAVAYEEIAHSQQDRGQCNVIMRDVSKAFFKVWHNDLEFKVCHLGLPKLITATLCSFLDHRKAQIQIENFTGQESELESGVPQGSCLSPTLYTIFTSDIHESPYDRKIIYADDITQIARYPGPSKEMLRRRTVRAIETVNDYEKQWKIKTNTTKFKIINISKKRRPQIEINGSVINYARTGTLLGLTLGTTGLTNFVNKKLQRAKQELMKLRRFSNFEAKNRLHLYKAFIQPHLDYATIPTNIFPPTNKIKPEIVQNKALRWINGDRPPLSSTIEELHNKYKLQPYNIKIFDQAMKVSEKYVTMYLKSSKGGSERYMLVRTDGGLLLTSTRMQ